MTKKRTFFSNLVLWFIIAVSSASVIVFILLRIGILAAVGFAFLSGPEMPEP
jgi:hypothetical protein